MKLPEAYYWMNQDGNQLTIHSTVLACSPKSGELIQWGRSNMTTTSCGKSGVMGSTVLYIA